MSRKPLSEELTPQALLERAYSLGNDEEARALYRDWAQSYDETMLEGLGYCTPRVTAALLARHVEDKTQPVLDVGSGTGLAGVELAGHGFTVLDALDYSPEMLAVAASRGVYRATIEADLNEPLDLPDGTYSAMICTGTFTHAHVGAGCLPELFRVLQPGGIFACTVHKDVWQEAGFAAESQKLAAAGILETVSHEAGTYYTASTDPEGWYIVWQKRK
ncbi:MAG: class I SAM-dependent methyltransferase [Nitratireductor sp.]|nr:class I SAM-dependent methyltransferase [Nitratireductor sp.]